MNIHFELLPVLNVSWDSISVKVVSTLLVSPLFRVFCDSFQFRVGFPGIFKDDGQLLNGIFQFFFCCDAWCVPIADSVSYWADEVFFFLTVFLNRLYVDVDVDISNANLNSERDMIRRFSDFRV